MREGGEAATGLRWVFLSTAGRLPRRAAIAAAVSLLVGFAAASILLRQLLGANGALLLHPLIWWCLLSIAIKRAHDYGASGARLLLALIPLFGLVYLLAELIFRGGTAGENAYGPAPRRGHLDYLVVRTPTLLGDGRTLVDDVTQLNATEVFAVVRPRSIEEIQEILRRSDAPISIGGGHFSQGGQTASAGTVHIDLRSLDRVVRIEPERRRVRVQAGVRWCDLQRALDPLGLSVRIMQTYANFTVGGALSVNAHGRYVGQGPVVFSVLSIDLVLADGRRVTASREVRPALFFGAIGGYGALGIIVEAELEVVPAARLRRAAVKLSRQAYPEHFRQVVRSDPRAVLHNADLYPPHFATLRSVTWSETDRFVTVPHRLMQLEPSHRLYRWLAWSISETPFGKWRREHLIDPLLYAFEAIHWRNYEAGYDVAELEPRSRAGSTYVLQEYFVPCDRFEDFVARMSEVFSRHAVNVINVSVRHAHADDGCLLAWAAEESFAFVVYYKQATDAAARGAVAVWTRELIDAALACRGRWYLPYQPHATRARG